MAKKHFDSSALDKHLDALELMAKDDFDSTLPFLAREKAKDLLKGHKLTRDHENRAHKIIRLASI